MRSTPVAGAAALAAVLLFGAAPHRPAAAPRSAPSASPPLLAFVWRGKEYKLGRVDPVSLKPLAGRLAALGADPQAWTVARSPRGTRIAVVSTNDIRIVDLGRMRVVRQFPGYWDDLYGLTWATPGRILAVSAESTRVDALSSGRVVWTRTLGGSTVGSAPVPGGVAVLLSPDQGIGTTTLAVIGANGSVRTAVLDRIRTGADFPEDGSTPIGSIAYAGLTVDAARGRAYVVPAGKQVAEVDLATMAVTYHELAHPVSVLGRLHDWLEPKAGAKGANGPLRAAQLLANGMLAVYGSDETATLDAKRNMQMTNTPSGLQLVDTRDWTVRSVDRTTGEIAAAGDVVLASGSAWADNKSQGHGLDVYAADGTRLHHMFGDSVVAQPDAVNALGYAWVGSSFTVLDLATGAVVARPAMPRTHAPLVLFP